MKRSLIRTKVEEIIHNIPRKRFYTCYIDNRKNGCYRMKFAYLHEDVTNEQIDKIRKLSTHITKVENIFSMRPGYGMYMSLAVHVNCRPSEIDC